MQNSEQSDVSFELGEGLRLRTSVPEPFPFMGKEQSQERVSEENETLPRWKEIRGHSEEERDEKDRLNLTISEYLKILEFGKNVEEESGGAAPEETDGECRQSNRTEKS